MNNSLEKKIHSLLLETLSDGFNRSINALEEAGAINTSKLRQGYTGVGSEYYDIVTNELKNTAKYTTETIIKEIKASKGENKIG